MLTEEEFFKAVLKGDDGIVKKAIDEGFDLNTLAPYSKGTALHTTVSLGNVTLSKILIDNGTNLEIRAEPGMTPLKLAIGSLAGCKKDKRPDYLAIITMLLEAGAKPTYTNRQGKEEFAYLCVSGRAKREVYEIFLKLGIVTKSQEEIEAKKHVPPIQAVAEKPVTQKTHAFKKTYLPQPSFLETVTSMFFGPTKVELEDSSPLIKSGPKLKQE